MTELDRLLELAMKDGDDGIVLTELEEQEYDSLKKKIQGLTEKGEKHQKLIESFTYDFEPIEDVEEIARQFIDNEIRTTHKLYEENKALTEQVKEKDEVIKILHHRFSQGQMQMVNIEYINKLESERDQLKSKIEKKTYHCNCCNSEVIEGHIPDDKR